MTVTMPEMFACPRIVGLRLTRHGCGSRHERARNGGRAPGSRGNSPVVFTKDCEDCAIGAAHARGEKPDVELAALVRREEVEVPKVTMVEHEGVTKPLGQWAREAGMDTETLRCRVKAGWDFAKALSTPVMSPRESGALSRGPSKPRRSRPPQAHAQTPAEAVRDALASVPVVELLARLGYVVEDAGVVPAGRLLLIRGAT